MDQFWGGPNYVNCMAVLILQIMWVGGSFSEYLKAVLTVKYSFQPPGVRIQNLLNVKLIYDPTITTMCLTALKHPLRVRRCLTICA